MSWSFDKNVHFIRENKERIGLWQTKPNRKFVASNEKITEVELLFAIILPIPFACFECDEHISVFQLIQTHTLRFVWNILHVRLSNPNAFHDYYEASCECMDGMCVWIVSLSSVK